MATRVVLLNALFDQFLSFLGELREMYPDDTDFDIFATSLKMLRTTNPSLVAKYIEEHTVQFENQILKKDEKFFLDYSFSEYGENVDLNIFEKLKQYINTMDSKSKENVWKYVQNIVRLSKAINSQ
jgi:hypothetical protein